MFIRNIGERYFLVSRADYFRRHSQKAYGIEGRYNYRILGVPQIKTDDS